MKELEMLEMFIHSEKEKAEKRLNTPVLMRHPEGLVDAYNIILRKIKELKGEDND